MTQTPAETLRAAAKSLSDQADRAEHKDRSVLLSPGEVRPIAKLLYAIAEDMDFDGADVRRRNMPGGTTEPGIFHGESGSYLHDWTWSWKLARVVLGDADA